MKTILLSLFFLAPLSQASDTMSMKAELVLVPCWFEQGEMKCRFSAPSQTPKTIMMESTTAPDGTPILRGEWNEVKSELGQRFSARIEIIAWDQNGKLHIQVHAFNGKHQVNLGVDGSLDELNQVVLMGELITVGGTTITPNLYMQSPVKDFTLLKN